MYTSVGMRSCVVVSLFCFTRWFNIFLFFVRSFYAAIDILFWIGATINVKCSLKWERRVVNLNTLINHQEVVREGMQNFCFLFSFSVRFPIFFFFHFFTLFNFQNWIKIATLPGVTPDTTREKIYTGTHTDKRTTNSLCILYLILISSILQTISLRIKLYLYLFFLDYRLPIRRCDRLYHRL